MGVPLVALVRLPDQRQEQVPHPFVPMSKRRNEPSSPNLQRESTTVHVEDSGAEIHFVFFVGRFGLWSSFRFLGQTHVGVLLVALVRLPDQRQEQVPHPLVPMHLSAKAG